MAEKQTKADETDTETVQKPKEQPTQVYEKKQNAFVCLECEDHVIAGILCEDCGRRCCFDCALIEDPTIVYHWYCEQCIISWHRSPLQETNPK